MSSDAKKPVNALNENLNDAIQAMEKTLELEGQAIFAALARVKSDSTPYRKALTLLNESLNRKGKIVVTGVGKSGKIAQKISATLSSTGSHATFLHPTEALHGDLGFVREEDCVIALSYTGNTEELLKLLPSFRARHIPILCISGGKDSQLSKQADVFLDGSVELEACPHNLAPTTSTTLALALGDALAVGLMKLRNFDPSLFALNHPGGSLGRRLTLLVKDVFHPTSELAIVGPDSSMEDVIVTSTAKKMGAALVAGKNGELLGIVTDGDLRRSLSHREKLFTLTAKDVMTKDPVSIGGEVLAEEALKLMRDRSSQISVLPVTEVGTHKILGLVRLHDLLRAF
jgi:arabinose-5-phosphate isomerase